MIFRKSVLVAITVLAVTNVAAQCATGVNTGGGNCVPPDAPGMPGYGTSASPSSPPPPKWIEMWGAIAIDSKTGAAGTVTDRDTKDQAVRDALRDCESHGARGCKVEVTYQNQCAAIAWGNGGHGFARGPDENTVGKNAMENCNGYATECKVVYSACTSSRRIR